MGLTNPLLVGADPAERLAVQHDALGLLAAQSVVQRAVALAVRLARP